MIYARLKKVYGIVSMHKRKIYALEQSLNTDEYGETLEMDKLKKMFGGFAGSNEEQKDFEIMSKEYSKLKLQIAEMKQEQNEWNDTKEELVVLNKRCTNLMRRLEKLSDEKTELTLQIEDLHAILNKHNLNYRQ